MPSAIKILPAVKVAEFTSEPNSAAAVVSLEWDLGMVGAMMGEDKLQHIMEKSLDKTLENWKKKAEQ